MRAALLLAVLGAGCFDLRDPPANGDGGGGGDGAANGDGPPSGGDGAPQGDGDPGFDGPPGPDGQVFAFDAGPLCSPIAAFTTSRILPNLNRTDARDVSPRLTPDELTIYFTSDRTAGSEDTYISNRGSITVDFVGVDPVPELVGSASLIMSRTGLSGYVSRHESDGTTNLFRVERDSINDPFGDPMPLMRINTTAAEFDPFVAPEDDFLYFSTSRGVVNDIYVADLASMADPAPVLGGVGSQTGPVLTADELHMYYESDTVPIRVSRMSPSSSFGPGTPMTEINDAAATEKPSWLSPDQCRLYYFSNLAGTFDLYVAERSPP